MRTKSTLLVFHAVWLLGLSAALAQATLVPDRLRCDYFVDPVGVDSAPPRLSWVLQAGDPQARGLHQRAYQILVASTPEALQQDHGDLWDSGEVVSAQMGQIPYAGQPLKTHQACWWKARAWDQKHQPGNWSAPARWTMGVVKDEDWSPSAWIGAPIGTARPKMDGPLPKYETVLLRREFTVKPGLKRAIISVCGLGQYELTANGSRVGDDLLAPGWTAYNKTCLYNTYDLTEQLRTGPNTLGLFLGNGMYLQHGGRFSSNTHAIIWFGPLQARALLQLDYADGSTETLGTDESWRCASGPITYSSIYGGEDFDSRLVPQGWDQPGFADAGWDKPQLPGGPGGRLLGLSVSAPPIRAFETLPPVATKVIRPGVTVYDFGQNASMIIRLTCSGPVGTVVRMSPAELTTPDGTIDRRNIGGQAWWQYTLAGTGLTETYQGKFFYQGARYVQVECPADPQGKSATVAKLEALVVHAAAPAVGDFSCSNPLFNRTHSLIRWAQQNNMVSTMTDCPTREKRGWLEQDHLNGPSLRFNWDLGALLTKVCHDMQDAQYPNGLCPTVAPEYFHFHGDFEDSPEWGSSCVVVPWQQYQFYGDTELLRRMYPTMQAYQAYLATKARNQIVAYGLGDWYDIGPKGLGRSQLTPLPLTGTAYYFYDTDLLARTARLLGHSEDATRYEAEAQRIAAAFNAALFHADANQYGLPDKLGSQASNSLPLVLGLADPQHRDALVANLVQDVQSRGLTAGDVGYGYLLRALAEGGRSDVIYALNNQSDKPGYGYQLKLGKTSLTEGWNGSASQDHFMLGQLTEWLYRDLAGIQPDPEAPGFARFRLQPALVGDLTWVKARYDSMSGRIVSEWTRDGASLTWHIVIPPNTSTTVTLPARDATSLQENGHPLPAHFEAARQTATVTLESGDYTLHATLPSGHP